jgi:hypothetical protein
MPSNKQKLSDLLTIEKSQRQRSKQIAAQRVKCPKPISFQQLLIDYPPTLKEIEDPTTDEEIYDRYIGCHIVEDRE